LSVRQVYSALQAYELQQGANESTYWLYFELLWREFFQWYAWVHGAKLFRFQGVNGPKPLTSFYDQRFRQWCLGNTPFPVVNACMKQLNSTGYLSNRGRQIVASCLVNELSLDWRYGAAYFEQALLDYDVGSNWGNWQYLAGVGADPRGQRHFDLEKQTRLYDPDHVFIDRWQGAKQMGLLDTIDATGWPIVD
jgi:deoxyribodipyrimidine photo-lyase